MVACCYDIWHESSVTIGLSELDVLAVEFVKSTLTILQSSFASTRDKSLQMTTAQDFSKYQETRLEGSPHRRVGEVPGHQPRGSDTQNQVDQSPVNRQKYAPCRAMSLSSDTSIDHLLLQLFNSNREIAPELTFFEAQHPAAKLHGWRSTPSLTRPRPVRPKTSCRIMARPAKPKHCRY